MLLANDNATQPVTVLKGVGPALSEKLLKLGIECLQDLLFHLPNRYLDRTRLVPLAALKPNQDVVIEGKVLTCDIIAGRRRSLLVVIGDETGRARLRFFHFSMAQKNALVTGKAIRVYGEARVGSQGLEIYHPEYQFLDKSPRPLDTALTPVYPTTEGLHQTRLRDICLQAIQLLDDTKVEDYIPAHLLPDKYQVPLMVALRFLHQPDPDVSLVELQSGTHPYQQRLALEELVAHQLSLQIMRRDTQMGEAAVLPVANAMEWRNTLLNSLGFSLTVAQQRVVQEIAQDLEQPVPMLRLVQGDVGAGKTLVAALAILQAVAGGKQAALMAPTEILAEQHKQSFQRWFDVLGIKTIFLSGRTKGKARTAICDMIADGRAQVAIGTHALFQDDVMFNDLSLVVIDEQHRFGVNQRLALNERNRSNLRPHQLIMTATPIPRTLAMSHYSNLDTSVIDELPPGRTPIQTVALSQSKRSQVVNRVSDACQQGRQAYWVCTLIEESDVLEMQAAEAAYDELRLSLPHLRIGLVHGRMKAHEKAEVMLAFSEHDIDLLVATTVIEVGVDVPNASLMIIENPERLGLSQLHQLRGRVGRGTVQSHCVLLYGSPLSRQSTERIAAMRQTSNGFELAEIDLKLRGPGELLGAKQSGDIGFHVADLLRDADLLPLAQQLSATLIHQYPAEASQVIRRWLPQAMQYSQA